MKLYIIGCQGPYPSIDGATGCYMVESQKAKILLDCGSGALQKLQRYTDIKSLDALVLSHLHGDHIADAFVLRYALTADCKLNVWLPADKSPEYDIISSASQYDTFEINEGKDVFINDLKLTFFKMVHPKLSYGVKITDGKNTISYTGDTVINPNIDKLVEGADVVLADCATPTRLHTADTPHMSLSQGASLAKGKSFELLVTHFMPEYKDDGELNKLNLRRVRQGEIYVIDERGLTLKK